jgi:hypothetical protein
LKTTTKIYLVAMLNFAVVGCSSTLAVHGNGADDDVNLVFGAGALWVFGFTAHALALAKRGDDVRAVKTVSMTLLYGLVAALAVSLIGGALQALWSGR